MIMSDDVVPGTFRALAESAEKKYARVRDLPVYGRWGPSNHYFQKVFKAYMRLWKYQQENRARLVQSGMQRWEIGEIASRIGQLYFTQYMRTSEAKFLLESYIFYEAILSRGYFDGSGRDAGVRFKELRFYARFLLVCLILNRSHMVSTLLERFNALVDDSRATFPGTNFMEWKPVLQEIIRFTKADASILSVRPLRYCVMFDSYPASRLHVARFHAKKVLKFRDAILTSYHKNEIKFAELTLDTFRMLHCLEWEPSGSFYKRPSVESQENGALADHSVTSGLIDLTLAAEMIDSTLPPNPKKAVLYRPFVTQLISVMAAVCEELPSECVMLIYLSASGNAGHSSNLKRDNSGNTGKSSMTSAVSQNSLMRESSLLVNHIKAKGESSHNFDNYLCLGPNRSGGSNNLYPGDIIPFTRRPLFLVIDSDNSHAFKVVHGAERGERCALLLSPLRPSFKSQTLSSVAHDGSQFTLFLADPLRAFCQMFSFASSDNDMNIYKEAESIISSAFSEWEVILCSSTSLDLVWAQVLSDSLLRRLILRFIFCRAVLTLFCQKEDRDQFLPLCLPELPQSLSPYSDAVLSAIRRLADNLDVAKYFHFHS